MMRLMMSLMMRLSRKAGISCAQVHDLVQSFLDGELEHGPERDRLVAHLDMCRPCGIEAEIYERIKATLAAEPPADGLERLMQFAAAVPELAGLADPPDTVEGAEES